MVIDSEFGSVGFVDGVEERFSGAQMRRHCGCRTMASFSFNHASSGGIVVKTTLRSGAIETFHLWVISIIRISISELGVLGFWG